MDPYWAVGAEREATEGPLRFLFVGRLIEGKGLDLLLEAFADASGSCPEASLWIVGSGPLKPMLQRICERRGAENVTFSGFVDQASLPALYAEAHVFVFPTLGDTFGMAMLEAAAAGLAIISSPWAGANDHLVEEEVSGTIIDPIDRAGLTQALVRLAGDSHLVAAWGREAHDRSRAHSPQETAAGYLNAIRQAQEAAGRSASGRSRDDDQRGSE
jgi:glycosyltransferase involved in cell wall biosynthesis